MNATRRSFLGTVTAASYDRILGANDRVQIGLVGYGLIGGFHTRTFKSQPDVDLAAVCDVYQPRLEAGLAACGPQARGYRDFRKMIENRDLQAVIVATPDHWHALIAILACAAGKDVYVEKPMTLFVKEGRWMVNAARRYGRVVQVGTQGRSAAHIPEVASLVRSGHIGKIHQVHIGTTRNIMPGFGAPPDSAPPPGLDYEMWLGPAPRRPYNPHRALYHFRWFWDYSGGQMTNLGAHDLDFVYLLMNPRGPASVFSAGGRFALTGDNGETPDTQDAILMYPGFNVTVTIREASTGTKQPAGAEFFGTKGSMTVSRDGFQVRPDMRVAPEKLIPAWSHPPGHPQPADIAPQPWTTARSAGREADPMARHARNFIDSIKSRKRPVADVEDGHMVATACHLANISLRLGGRVLHWDAEKEQIVGDPEANAWIERPYRKPWNDVLGGLSL